jgi:hypothetical protein
MIPWQTHSSDYEIVVVCLLSEAAVINLERRSRECWAAQAGQLWDTRPHLRQTLEIAIISALRNFNCIGGTVILQFLVSPPSCPQVLILGYAATSESSDTVFTF